MDLLDTILTNTYTTADLRHRIHILRDYFENTLYGRGLKNLNPEDASWLRTLPADFFKFITKENMYSIFKELEENVSKLIPLIIYLSFEAQKEQIDGIGLWIQKNLSEKPLIEIKLDPSLLGGVALVQKGVYRDYSLRKKIQEHGDEILIEFKKYIR